MTKKKKKKKINLQRRCQSFYLLSLKQNEIKLYHGNKKARQTKENQIICDRNKQTQALTRLEEKIKLFFFSK